MIDHACRIVATAGVSLPVLLHRSASGLRVLLHSRLGAVAVRPSRRIRQRAASCYWFLSDRYAAGGPTSRGWASVAQLTLPAVTLAVFALAPIARMTRGAMLSVLESDFVRTARAAGLKPTTVIITYAFRNALLPVITTLGMVLPSLRASVGASVARPGMVLGRGRSADRLGLRSGSGIRSGDGNPLPAAQPGHRHRLRADRSTGEDRRMSAAGADAARPASGLSATIQHARHVIVENPATGIAFALFLLLLLMALLGPAIAPYDPLATDSLASLKPPSAHHWFGTDQLGRDIFSRVAVATPRGPPT